MNILTKNFAHHLWCICLLLVVTVPVISSYGLSRRGRLSPHEIVINDDEDTSIFKYGYWRLPDEDINYMLNLQAENENNAANLAIEPGNFLALADLYKSCNGPNWKWYGHGNPWNFSTNPCTSAWEGVMCNCNMSKPSTV